MEWLPKHYSVVLAEALRDVGRPNVELVFVPDGPGALEEACAHPAVSSRHPRDSSLLEVRRRRTPVPQRLGSLIPRYTFDAFIVGPSNQFAHAACRAIAETPSQSYNPLFITAASASARRTDAGHRPRRGAASARARLGYISSERFINEMINAMSFDSMIDFR